MWLLTIAIIAAGLFAGAAIYINVVEHPARVSCGTELAIQEFGPSYHRAAMMQASLAIVGGVGGLIAGWQQRDAIVVIGALLLAGVVPFTIVIIAPINKQLLDPNLNRRGSRARLGARRFLATPNDLAAA
jgi:Anthrone oxygenase